MPPLNAMRAFEAASRRESFARAADEMGVTAAAVSQQVRILEEWLGSPLFVRMARGLRLTEAGRSAMPLFSAAFDSLGFAVQELKRTAPSMNLSVAALPAIAQLWLAPRLSHFRQAQPDARVSLHALEHPPNFRREPFDVGLFLLREPREGFSALSICDDVIFPVCTPAIAAKLNSPDDLRHQTLLIDTGWPDDWECWLRAAGFGRHGYRERQAFSLYSLAVQAATDGAGVLIAHRFLVGAQLASGDLVLPYDHAVSTGRALSVLLPERPSAAARRFVDWLAGEQVGDHA